MELANVLWYCDWMWLKPEGRYGIPMASPWHPHGIRPRRLCSARPHRHQWSTSWTAVDAKDLKRRRVHRGSQVPHAYSHPQHPPESLESLANKIKRKPNKIQKLYLNDIKTYNKLLWWLQAWNNGKMNTDENSRILVEKSTDPDASL